VHVSVQRDPEEGWIRLAVEDNGVGIPAENLPHIFDRFYRVRNAQTNYTQGLGLGLSFVSWIVSAHEGAIHVESNPGAGSKFIVRLPAAMAAQETAPEPAVTTV
jgi:signal transduction histidine kinase